MKNKILNNLPLKIEGYVKIFDMSTNALIFQGQNDVNPEAMSYIIAKMLRGNNSEYIYQVNFGSGGTVIDETGNVTYKNVEENLNSGLLANLYNPIMLTDSIEFAKVVDESDSTNNTNTLRNNIEIVHLDGLPYTDLVITCTLEEEDPVELGGEIIFDELGLKSRPQTGFENGFLLTHIVFDPVEKNRTRIIQVIYTLRVRF